VTYSARKLEGARHQIGLIRGALFTLENRLVCASDRDPAAVEAIKALYRDVAVLEQYLAHPTVQATTAASLAPDEIDCEQVRH
jgi:hypothetical protein